MGRGGGVQPEIGTGLRALEKPPVGEAAQRRERLDTEARQLPPTGGG